MLSLSSSSSSSSLFELYTPATSTRGESPVLGKDDGGRPVGYCDDERGDSPLLGWEGDCDSTNPLLFPSPGYERDLPQGQEASLPDFHAHPLALQHHRDSISIASIHSSTHSRSFSRPVSQEVPLPLPASVIPQLQKRKRVSKNPSLGQVPQYGIAEVPQASQLPQPTSPHCVPLPSSPTPTDGFHIPSTSISSISSISAISSPTTPMYDAFNAVNHSPVKTASTNATPSPMLGQGSLGIHSHSRAGSAAASMHSLSLSLSSDSCRNAVYISDESDLEVLDYTLNSPHGSVLDLGTSQDMEEVGNTKTIYVPNQEKETAHHRIGSAFLLPELAISLTSRQDGSAAEDVISADSSTGPNSRKSSQRPLSTGSTSSRLYVGPSTSAPHGLISPATPGTSAAAVMAAFAKPTPPVTPHLSTTLKTKPSYGSGLDTSPENSPYAPSFAFSARESSGSSGGTRTSHGHSESADCPPIVALPVLSRSPEPQTPIEDSVDERERKLQSRWSVTSSMIEFPSVPPSTPAFGSTLALPLPPAPKPSEEQSQYPMPLNRAPTVAMKEDGNGKRRSRRSSLVPFVNGLRETLKERADAHAHAGFSEDEKEEKGKKAFKKAMMRLQGQGSEAGPSSLQSRGQRKRASSSFGRTEGTSISVAIAEAAREYKDVTPSAPLSPPFDSTSPSSSAPTVSKRKRLASLISRLSLAPSASHPNIRSLAAGGLGPIPATPPTPDFPTPTSSSPSPRAGIPSSVPGSPPPPTINNRVTSGAPLGSSPRMVIGTSTAGYPPSPPYSPTSGAFSPVSMSSCSTAMPGGSGSDSGRPSLANEEPEENPMESSSENDEKMRALSRHRHFTNEAEVNPPVGAGIANEDAGSGQGVDQGRPSISTASSGSLRRLSSTSAFPQMPFPPSMNGRPSVSSSSGFTSPPRSPTKMRFAVNGTELELEIPPAPLGPAPTPPGVSPSTSNASLSPSPIIPSLMPSPVPLEFGGPGFSHDLNMGTIKRLPPTPPLPESSPSRDAPHIRITPDSTRGDVHKTPTKRKKFSTMLGLRGSRSESVLRLENSPKAGHTSPQFGGAGMPSPPPASPPLPGSLSSMHSPMPSPALSGSLSPPPPMSPPPQIRSPLASSFTPNVEKRQSSVPVQAAQTMKSRPKSAGGGLRERFRALRAWQGQQSHDEPPPVPSKEGVGMAF